MTTIHEKEASFVGLRGGCHPTPIPNNCEAKACKCGYVCGDIRATFAKSRGAPSTLCDLGFLRFDRPQSGNKWFPFPRIPIPFFSRGTKHEHKPESPCRNGADAPFDPQTTAQARHSTDVSGLGRAQTLPGGVQMYRPGYNPKWPASSAYTRSLDQQSHSSRANYHQPFSPAPHRASQVRAGSLDFWSSSLALAGLHPDGEVDPEMRREPYSVDLECRPSDTHFQNSGM